MVEISEGIQIFGTDVIYVSLCILGTQAGFVGRLKSSGFFEVTPEKPDILVLGYKYLAAHSCICDFVRMKLLRTKMK